MTEPPDPELRFLGPLLSVARVEDHLPLFANVFGLEARAIQQLDEEQVQALWGIDKHAAGTVLLETGETRTGIQLIQFSPGVDEDDTEDANVSRIRGLQFLTRNFEVARHVLERNGYEFRSIARYSLPDRGAFTEGLVVGAEGIRCTVLRAHDLPADRVLRITDRLFGELLSVSIGVPNLDAAAAFYELLGLEQVFRTQPVLEAVDGEVRESDRPEWLEGVGFGTTPRAPLITLVPDPSQQVPTFLSLERSLLGRVGCVALRFQSASVEPIRKRLWSAEGQRLGARILAFGRGILEPLGAVESLLVRGPHGVIHQFLGRL